MATFCAFTNRDKGNAYIEALLDAGHHSSKYNKAEFLLIDYEQNALRKIIHDFISRGKPVFVYPHSATSDVLWDGIYKPLSISCNFVPGEGQKKVMNLYGYPNRVEPVGWSYSTVRDFTPTRGRKLLFAPKHPNAFTGSLRDTDRAANQSAFALILDSQHLFDSIVVRYAGNIRKNGIRKVSGGAVRYEPAIMDIDETLSSIVEADIVVSCETVAYLSVAMGKPTIFFGQDIPPHNIRYNAKHYRDYESFRAFPLNTNHCKDNMRFKTLVDMACIGNYMVEEWKKLFIGSNFDSEKFVAIVESYLH